MQNRPQANARARAGGKAGIWLALVVALGLHSIILFLPISRQGPVVESSHPQIELQLTTYAPPIPAPQIPVQQAETVPPLPEPAPEVSESLVEIQAAAVPPVLTPTPQSQQLEVERLTNSILTRQFITEESVADQLFGKPLDPQGTEAQKEFHFPHRQDMLSMLDQPMPELPFAYTPGLVRFAYEPGVKGDLQRFWDVITPEFGWTTNNGTEFKCIWVLIVGGCGWK
jgi:hypothetical protein